MNVGYAALKFAGTPNTYGYAKFDKTVSGGWIEFGYFTSGSDVAEWANTISVYPNPVTETLSIRNAEGSRVAIYNANGQIVKLIEKAEPNATVNVTSLSVGVYYVQITQDNRVNTVKFVKQ